MKKILPALFLILFCFSCTDEAPRFTVPWAPVNFKVETEGLDFELKAALSYKTFTTENARTNYDRFGYSGLLLVRDAQASSLFAYDLCCPHEDKREIIVKPTTDGKAVCPSCGSVYTTMYGLGSVESGVSREPLQRYTVIPQSGGVFIVRNLIEK